MSNSDDPGDAKAMRELLDRLKQANPEWWNLHPEVWEECTAEEKKAIREAVTVLYENTEK
ncbi:MAG: hypothetical protein ACFCUQ_18055 [Kiloniellales bacterium]